MGTEKTHRAKHLWLENYMKAFWKKYPNGEISLKKISSEFAIKLYASPKIARDILGAYAALKIIDIHGDVVTKTKKWSK